MILMSYIFIEFISISISINIFNFQLYRGCRVIARLMRERDEARSMLASASVNMTAHATAVAVR